MDPKKCPTWKGCAGEPRDGDDPVVCPCAAHPDWKQTMEDAKLWAVLTSAPVWSFGLRKKPILGKVPNPQTGSLPVEGWMQQWEIGLFRERDSRVDWFQGDTPEAALKAAGLLKE